MEKSSIEQYLSTFKCSEPSFPFGPEAKVFKVMGKMFALVSQEAPYRVTLKVDPFNGEALVEQYESVVPGYYMNKKHWITITLGDAFPTEILKELCCKSYSLVVNKLTKMEKVSLRKA